MGYKEMYYHLAGKVSDAVETLQTAMQTAEEMYLEGEDATITLLPDPEDDTEK